MNNKFLNKVADRLVKETRIDFTRGRVYPPYIHSLPSQIYYFPLYRSSSFFSSYPSPLFSEHCENVYALNNEEMDYVWKEYGNIIDNKIIKELV